MSTLVPHISEEEIWQRAEAVFSAMEARSTLEEMDMMRRAYQLAHDAHANQKRKTGEPYIIHPIAVALIVAEEMNLGAAPVCAAFLHDVVEDTPYTEDDIRERFGDDVAFLVRVVTKQKKARYDMTAQLDNFKKMLDSMHYDVRAILIKLADRLHNMRTLDSMRPAKQMKIAGETDYFYAPLANRLGLYKIKIELENLSFRYRCPQIYNKIVSLIEKDKEQEKIRMASFGAKIDEVLTANGIRFRREVAYRAPYSLYRKMNSQQVDFEHLECRHFTRIVFPEDIYVSEKNMCLNIYSYLTNCFRERLGSMINYIDQPKQNGYQSFHVSLLSDYGIWEEVHISVVSPSVATMTSALGLRISALCYVISPPMLVERAMVRHYLLSLSEHSFIMTISLATLRRAMAYVCQRIPLLLTLLSMCIPRLVCTLNMRE